MALIYDSVGDFVLFPRDQVFPDLLTHPSANNFGGFYQSSTDMDQHSQFAMPARTTYDSYPVTTSYSTSTAYYEAPKPYFSSMKVGDESSMPRPTPSASPSSMSQTFDQPSVLSSTSGASAQSAASSVGGSPYARPTQQMPFQDKWSDPLQGLGISSKVASGDFLGFDASRQHFVGEYKESLSSSMPSVGQAVSSISLAPALQEFSSSYHFPRGPPSDSHREETTIDTILQDINRRNTDQTLLVSPASSTSTTGPPIAFPIKGVNAGSPTMSPPPLNERPLGLNSPHGSLTPPSSSPTSFRKPQDPFFSQSSGRFVAPLHSSYPALIQQLDTPVGHSAPATPYTSQTHIYPPIPSQNFQSPSPAPSDTSSHDPQHPGSKRLQSFTGSPYLHSASYQPYPPAGDSRRLSVASNPSHNSMESPGSLSFDDEGRERTRCPHPDCGRPFKDLKAHLLTHQRERPEKCPISTCAYHVKGFSRKYDKNRHTLTHYKGNIVCGFCPGSGSAAEKSFNRADVFKRHLASVHGAEQNPPNGRKKSPTGSNGRGSTSAQDVSGRCSTCLAMFKNAQELYEHLDDCLLHIVQQEEPSEAINERIMRSVANDDNVRETLDRHTLPLELTSANDFGNGSDAEGDDEDGNDYTEDAHNQS